MAWQLDHAKAEDWLPQQADASADLILVDPPYFRVKDEPWDRQWDTAAGFLAWLDSLAAEWRRILKPNGSLYVFASPQMSTRVEMLIGERFAVLNNIRWYKEAGWHQKAKKEDLRAFLSPWEAIIFAEQEGADAGFSERYDALRGEIMAPLWRYLDGERRRAKVNRSECNNACGFAPTPGAMAARKYFGPSQFCLPTREHYAALHRLLNLFAGGPYLTRRYDDLRAEYDRLAFAFDVARADLAEEERAHQEKRRLFAVDASGAWSDHWTFSPVQQYPGKHPCEKPLAMLRHIISASTRPGALVLDCFAGSGNTGIAARQLGRDFVGCDASPVWSVRGARRVADAALQAELPLGAA